MVQRETPGTFSKLDFDRNGNDGISLSAPVIMALIESVLEKKVSFRFQARGYSMVPAIRNNDLITVSPLGDLLPRRGDVLAFRHPDRPQMLVHRVLGMKEKKYFIRGDNCPATDGWIPLKNILGEIMRVERSGIARFWSNRTDSPSWSGFYPHFYLFCTPGRRWLVGAWRRLRRFFVPIYDQ